MNQLTLIYVKYSNWEKTNVKNWHLYLFLIFSNLKPPIRIFCIINIIYPSHFILINYCPKQTCISGIAIFLYYFTFVTAIKNPHLLYTIQNFFWLLQQYVPFYHPLYETLHKWVGLLVYVT